MNGWKQDSSDWELKKDETAGMWSGTFTLHPENMNTNLH